MTGSKDRPQPQVPPLPWENADCADWQQARPRSARLYRPFQMCRQTLVGPPRVLDLPTDRPWPAVSTFRGATHTLAVPCALCEAARFVVHREGSTVFMTILAALQSLLHRHAGQHDLIHLGRRAVGVRTHHGAALRHGGAGNGWGTS